MVLWSQQRNLVANRDKVKQKIFKICFCSLKLQVCAHLNVKQVWRGEAGSWVRGSREQGGLEHVAHLGDTRPSGRDTEEHQLRKGEVRLW